jgi:hypothetical protein
MMKPLYYKLLGKIPVPCTNTLEWGAWFESHFEDRVVAKTDIGPMQVSTVFVGLDMSFFGKDPLLFETMVFNDEGEDLLCNRYHTWGEAEAGHAKAVEFAAERLYIAQDDIATAMDH